jgi:hypothetical protein
MHSAGIYRQYNTARNLLLRIVHSSRSLAATLFMSGDEMGGPRSTNVGEEERV